MKMSRLAALAAVPFAAALLLAGCTAAGNGAMPAMGHTGVMSSASPSGRGHGEVNAADRMFTMMMIPHHQQAVQMSDTLLGKSGVDQQVRDLAQRIKDAQTPEITLMESWLAAWGMPYATQMSGMGHGDAMMSQDDMAALEAADGSAAAPLFLQQMIVHHQGAIEMAQSEIDNGVNPDVIALARSIVTSQTAEIATMKELLARL